MVCSPEEEEIKSWLYEVEVHCKEDWPEAKVLTSYEFNTKDQRWEFIIKVNDGAAAFYISPGQPIKLDRAKVYRAIAEYLEKS